MRCLPANLVSGAFEDGEDYRMKHVDKKTEPFLKPAKGLTAGRSDDKLEMSQDSQFL
jgi:hypothetical protein